MSIIVACVRDGVVYMGADTKVIINDTVANELMPSCYKIQRLDNGVLLGVSAERKERQAIFAHSEIFTLDRGEKLTRKQLVTCIIPQLMDMLKAERLLQKEEDRSPHFKGVILIAHKDALYEICSDFSVIRYEDFQCVGNIASDYAQGVMFNPKYDQNPNERIIEALKISAKHSFLVGAPYILINTLDLEYTVVGGNE